MTRQASNFLSWCCGRQIVIKFCRVSNGKLRSTGDLSDLTVQIGDRRLALHRFPLIARSNYFRCLQRSGMSDNTHVTLDGFPGGPATMELIADFCYNVPIWDRLNASNVGHALCASSYLQMNGPNNLTEKCRSRVETLADHGVSTCLDILINCIDVKRAADQEGLTNQCVEAAVRHWLQIHDFGETFPLSTHPDSKRWMSQIGQLPIDWVTKILDAIQTGSCHVLLRAHVASKYLTFIMEMLTSSIQHRKDDTEIASGLHNDCQMVSNGSEQNSTKIGSAAPENGSEGQLKSGFVLNTYSEQDFDVRGSVQEGESNGTASQVTKGLSRLSLDDIGALLQAFDVVTGYIPEDHAIYKVVPASWFATAVRFASEQDVLQHSTQKLTSLCAPVYDQLELEDIQDMQPIVLSRLNDSTRNNREGLQFHVLKLTDLYLFQRASMGSIEPSHFALLLNLQYRRLRKSYDQVFEALELMISSRSMSDIDVHNILQYMDFTKLSQTVLERAANSERIPRDTVLKAALAVCSRLRQVEDDRQTEIATLERELRASMRRPGNHLQGQWIPKRQQTSAEEHGLQYYDKPRRTADLPDSEIVMKITSGEVPATSTSRIGRKLQPEVVAIDTRSGLDVSFFLSETGRISESRSDWKDRRLELDEKTESKETTSKNSNELLVELSLSRRKLTTTIAQQYSRRLGHRQRETYHSEVEKTTLTCRTSCGYFMPLHLEKRPPTDSASSLPSLEERPSNDKLPSCLVYDMSSDTVYTGKCVEMTRWERKDKDRAVRAKSGPRAVFGDPSTSQ